MQLVGWSSTIKASDTRHIESNLHSWSRDSLPSKQRISIPGFRFCRLSTSSSTTRRQVHLFCGSVSNVYFITHSDYEVYTSMDSDSVDVKFLWERLSQQLGHLTLENRRRVAVGLIVAYAAHDGQKRKSGEPFITHPVEVARILGGLYLDADTIIAGLLHDTVEDTDRLSFEEIEQRFGVHVRRIVEAETRLTKIVPTRPGERVKDLDFQHFFMCMSQDVRILLVKLADRLHNMRTMASMKTEKQKEKAAETLQVYAPLAGLLGLDTVKEEMEVLSLRYFDPDRYFELKDHLKKLEAVQETILKDAKDILERKLQNDPLLAKQVRQISITARQKSIYSLYKIYKRSQWKLEGNQRLNQVAQLHVLLDTDDPSAESAAVCYYVLGVIHLLWSPIPGKLKDCIATPKPSSWKGLSTNVWPSSGARLVTPIEILIQTSHMSTGNVAQWQPSQWNHIEADDDVSDDESNSIFDSSDETEFNLTLRNGFNRLPTLSYRSSGFGQAQIWLENLQKWQHEIGTKMSPRDYVDCIRDDFLSPSVYVFTPAGEFVQLPEGATVLDFAYHIHAHIGNHAVGARVDGCNVGPRTVLRNAQVVEILTADWKKSREHYEILQSRMPALQTKSARRKLKNFLRQYQADLEKENLNPQMPPPQRAFASESCFWVMVYVHDGPGILADVARVISSHGLNITRHWGFQNLHGDFVMKYHVHDPGGSRAPELMEQLALLRDCKDVVMGCTLPELSQDPQGWHFPVNGRT